MKHLLFFIGLMTTASTGQDKSGTKGPILLPQAPAPVVKKAEELPPLPAPSATAETAKADLSVYTNDLHNNAPYIPLMFDQRRRPDRKTEVKKGEIKALVKILAQIPAHLHGRDYKYIPSVDQTYFYLAIEDKALKLPLAKATFQKDGLLKEIALESANIQKVIENEKNPYSDWGMSDNLVRLASHAKDLIGHDNFSTLQVEGEMEYLIMDALLENKPHLRHRETFSTHTPQVGRNYMYHAITLADKEMRTTIGVVGFFHRVQPPYELVDLITSVGPKAQVQDVTHTFAERLKAAQPTPATK